MLTSLGRSMRSGIKIEKMVNGYEVCFSDPDIEKENRSPKAKGWRDPEREIAFTSKDALIKFLEQNLDKLCATDDYETGFTKALMES